MKDYDPINQSSCLIYWCGNNLYGWAISQKFLVNGFKWRNYKFNFYEDFIQRYYENRDKRYIFEVNVDYPRELQKAHKEIPFLLK